MRIASLILGIVSTIWVLSAIAATMLMPRRAHSFVGKAVTGFMWRGVRLPISVFRSYEMQDRWLAIAAPLSLVGQLIVYASALILTLGLVVFGLTDLSLADSMYQSGSTFTTLGIVEPVNSGSTITTFIAAFLGLVVIGIFVGYLIGIYSSFQSRESRMARLSQIAGEPAWGPEILRRAKIMNCENDDFIDSDAWLDWFAAIQMSMQVTPILRHFRSTSPTRHWVTSALAVLDCVALRESLSSAPPDAKSLRCWLKDQ